MTQSIITKVNQVKRNFIIYAIIIVIGLLLNLFDGNIEDGVDFGRGLIRSVMMVYLAFQLPKLQKSIWWISVIFCGILTFFGILAIALMLMGGLIFSYKLLFLIISAAYAFKLIATSLFILLNKDVKEAFIH